MSTVSILLLPVDTLFSYGFFDIAENAYAQILQQALEDDDSLLEISVLKSIGDVYLEKGRLSKDGKDFTKASALYNAALVRCADWDGRQSLVHRIKRTEKCFMRYVAGIHDTAVSPRKDDIARKVQLQKIRVYCKEQLRTLSSRANCPYIYKDNPIESEEARNAERRRTEAVRSLYHYVTVKMKQFSADMVEECIETLGPVPCQYAMVGMGSICREEMTPYSDLEFAILVKEGKCTDQNKSYFRTLTHLLHLKVLNLGETILPSMAIKSLNDFNNKETDWYYDDTTPCGFSFDGSMPWASKTALGRDQTSSKPALELIMTPTEMAELQKDERSVKEGYHLADVLCNVTLISGEQTLVEAYRNKVQELLDLPSQVRLGLTVRAQRALAALNVFHIARESILKHFPFMGDPIDVRVVNVKKVLYRLGSLIVESLGVMFSCLGESVEATLTNLLQIKSLTPEAYHNLSTVVAIVDELRLQHIGGLSAALGDHGTAINYLEEDLRLELSLNKREYSRENEMTTRFQLWQVYTEMSMQEEAEKHRLGWIHCLHPRLSEVIGILVLQRRTSIQDAQCQTIEDGFQMFGEAVHSDKSVVPWDLAVYILNYSALLENQKRHADVERLFETVLDKLGQCEDVADFDRKIYPRMVAFQAACLFYMRQGNREKSLECLQTVLKCSTHIFNDVSRSAINVYTDQASVNHIHFCTAVLNIQHSLGYKEEVKKEILADIDRVCSIVLFRATTFGPKLVETCTDCIYASGKTLENTGETLAAVEMFHVGLKICTSQESFAKALVFLTSMFRARGML
ncbi:hypothetical protein Bbelb_389760 [Branchiostoma belcheri]|nr:hypothetical protein Bbelb_389760 [Branchiostoma belcheri]